MKITYEKASNGEFFVTIKARNGKTLFTSETYKQKASARKAVASLISGLRDYKVEENW